MKTGWTKAGVMALLGWVLAAGFARAASDTNSTWLTDFEQAKKAAETRKIPILADFSGSDWCGWCIRLDQEVFSKTEFKQYAAKHVVLFLADFPRRTPLSEALAKQNRALGERYEVKGFPTVLLLDKDGKVLARTGYRPGGADAYVAHLKQLVGGGAD
jgi:thioredoxin-related protein